MEVLLNELIQGKELTEKLRETLKLITSPEERQFLVEKILSSYEKALALLNWEDKSTIHPNLGSPLLSNCSSDFAEQECVDNSPRNVYKKRKTQPRWTEQVKVCSGSGLEGPIDDGYSWRKYGQKDILGATFPRGYYRCTHRHSQGCLATKQVQRSDQDPTTFEVTYRGRHTCFQSSPVINEKSKSNKESFDQFEEHEEKPKPIQLKQLSFNFRDGFKIQESEPVDDIFPSFSFSFPDADNIFTMENNLLGSFSPEFVSPATSDFSASPSHMYSFGLDFNGTMSESNPASVNNSPISEWDISSDFKDFEANFPLEKPEL